MHCSVRQSVLPLCILLLYVVSPTLKPCALYAEVQNEWIIAASPFVVTSLKGLSPQTAESASTYISELLPSLILEKIQYLKKRTIFKDELEMRRLYDMRQKRLAVSLELSAAVKERDMARLGIGSEINKKKTVEKAEKKIADIRKNLDVLLHDISDVESSLAQGADDSDEEGSLISIRIWKDDPASLFTADTSNQKTIVSEKISALITGTVSILGDYISVKVALTVYPGIKKVIEIHEVGSLEDIELLASRIAQSLMPSIMQSVPASLVFTLSPVDSRVYVDGELFSHTEPIYIGSGIHSVVIEHDSYKSAEFNYSFEAGKEYGIQVSLSEVIPASLNILTGGIGGTLFLDGKAVGITDGHTGVSVRVNNQMVLGEFYSDTGIKTFFTISPETMINDELITITPLTVSLREDIEKKRKTMYNSLGALFISLPFALITWGSYVDTYNAWGLGLLPYAAQNEVETRKLVSNITTGISIGLGINVAIQIGRYLYAAYKVIPQEAKSAD